MANVPEYLFYIFSEDEQKHIYKYALDHLSEGVDLVPEDKELLRKLELVVSDMDTPFVEFITNLRAAGREYLESLNAK